MRYLLLLVLGVLLAGCVTAPPRYADCRDDPVWGCPSDYGPTHYEVCRPIMYGVGRCTTY